jgi:D-alanyl-D-alanine carboxypeptidase
MLSSSVGNLGKNQKSDVLLVQKLLNSHPFSGSHRSIFPLNVDGACGKKTIAAIEQFQSEVVGMARPDGRIDPGGKSIKVLDQPSGGFKQVPLAAGVGVKVSTDAKPNSQTPVVQMITTDKTDPRLLKTRAEIAKAYGSISQDLKWSRQAEFFKPYTVPAKIYSHKDYAWINVYSRDKSKVNIVYCHKAMHSFIDKALNNVLDRGLLAQLTEFGGSLCIRSSRGSSDWSAHSWGLAIDINMTGNGFGQTPKMSKELVSCFTDAGFGWGGNYSRKRDGMHFTIAGFDMPSK